MGSEFCTVHFHPILGNSEQKQIVSITKALMKKGGKILKGGLIFLLYSIMVFAKLSNKI